jgi:glycosyltransferase involved in cell wall biosynthesis
MSSPPVGIAAPAMDRQSLEPIVHLSTSRVGGAAIAAARIVSAQCVVGAKAEIVYRGVITPNVLPSSAPSRGIRIGAAQRISSRLLTKTNRFLSRPPTILFTPLGTSLTRKQIEKQFGHVCIINLHNVYNFVSVQRILQTLPGVHVVATLHDERLFTAGCHYSLGCDGFSRNCRPCPQGRSAFGRSMTSNSAFRQLCKELRFSIVAPSRWLTMQVLDAGFPEERLSTIPNPIDPEVFSTKPIRQPDSDDSLRVGWLPGKLEAPFWDAIRQAESTLGDLGSPRRIKVLTPSTSWPSDLSIIKVAPPQSESDRSHFWSSVDVGVSMTAADNFPNVVLEALSVGTPFIINAVGGAAEAVTATTGGAAIPTPSAPLLASALVSAAQEPALWLARGRDGAKGTRDLYSPRHIGSMYLEHYWRHCTAS